MKCVPFLDHRDGIIYGQVTQAKIRALLGGFDGPARKEELSFCWLLNQDDSEIEMLTGISATCEDSPLENEVKWIKAPRDGDRVLVISFEPQDPSFLEVRIIFGCSCFMYQHTSITCWASLNCSFSGTQKSS